MKEKKAISRDNQRMMKLIFTDGVNDYQGFEENRLFKVSSFEVGDKWLIRPPVEVRRGLLYLKSENVEVLWSQSP